MVFWAVRTSMDVDHGPDDAHRKPFVGVLSNFAESCGWISGMQWVNFGKYSGK